MDYPLVTIVMPIRNEAAFIARSLGAVLAQTYPAGRLEILVIDGMSTDSTLAMIQQLPEASRVRVIANPRHIQAAALNLGLAQAHGDIVVRVDGHTIISPTYVAACVAALTTSQAEVVGGAMTPIGVTRMGRAIAAATQSPFGVPTAFHHSQRSHYTDTVYLGAWPRQVLTRHGGFDETVHPNEDYELNYRIRRAGGKVYLDAAITSTYYGRQTLSALISQYFRYGQAKVRTLRKYPQSVRPRQLIAPAFVAFLATGLLLGALSPPLRWLWLGLIALYSGLVAFFSLRATPQGDAGLMGRVAVVFPTIHLAWGSGFWVELARQLLKPWRRVQDPRPSH